MNKAITFSDAGDNENSSSPIPPPSSLRLWHALDVTLETRAREAVEYAVMEAGALGTECNDTSGDLLQVVAYFDEVPNRTQIRDALAEALKIYDLPTSAVRDMQVREVEDRDWLGEWKKNWQPTVIGRFVIAPPWSNVVVEEGRHVIRIEPGMAFGTGTHQTTRLCLAAMAKYSEGESFLDVGTGTGILAIAAAKLSPTVRIEACDVDPDAVEIARENARLNGVADRIDFYVGTVNDTTASANIVCANLTADVIVSLLPRLLDATCGRLVLSGILQEQLGMVEARLREVGVTEFEIESDGEWIAIVV
jgi:ribosomal protein L11 methyltransferase